MRVFMSSTTTLIAIILTLMVLRTDHRWYTELNQVDQILPGYNAIASNDLIPHASGIFFAGCTGSGGYAADVGASTDLISTTTQVLP